MNSLRDELDWSAVPTAWSNATGSIAAMIALKALAAIVQKHGPHYRLPGGHRHAEAFGRQAHPWSLRKDQASRRDI